MLHFIFHHFWENLGDRNEVKLVQRQRSDKHRHCLTEHAQETTDLSESVEECVKGTLGRHDFIPHNEVQFVYHSPLLNAGKYGFLDIIKVELIRRIHARYNQVFVNCELGLSQRACCLTPRALIGELIIVKNDPYQWVLVVDKAHHLGEES